MDSAVGQIPRSTERISSWSIKCFFVFFKFQKLCFYNYGSNQFGNKNTVNEN